MRKQILLASIFLFVSYFGFCQTQKYSADIDGNGIVDQVSYTDHGDNIVDIIVTLRFSNGTVGSPFTFAQSIDRGYPDKDWGFADVNGDGRADFLTVRGVPGKLEQVTYFNKITFLDQDRNNVSFIPYLGRMKTEIPIAVKKIICSFNTTNDDKDWDSQVGVQFYYDQRVLAETFCCSSDRNGDHWGDNTNNPPIEVVLQEPLTTQQLEMSTLVISLKASGNDKWRYDVRIKALLIDGNSRNWTFTNNVLDSRENNRVTANFNLSKR